MNMLVSTRKRPPKNKINTSKTVTNSDCKESTISQINIADYESALLTVDDKNGSNRISGQTT